MSTRNNPLAFRLGKNSPWKSVYHHKYISNEKHLLEDLFIRKLVVGLALNLGFLPSEIIIKKTWDSIHLSFKAYPFVKDLDAPKHKKYWLNKKLLKFMFRNGSFFKKFAPQHHIKDLPLKSRQALLQSLLKSLLSSRFGTKIELSIYDIQFLTENADVLSHFIDLKFQEDISRFRGIVNEVFVDWKSHKDYQKTLTVPSDFNKLKQSLTQKLSQLI